MTRLPGSVAWTKLTLRLGHETCPQRLGHAPAASRPKRLGQAAGFPAGAEYRSAGAQPLPARNRFGCCAVLTRIRTQRPFRVEVGPRILDPARLAPATVTSSQGLPPRPHPTSRPDLDGAAHGGPGPWRKIRAGTGIHPRQKAPKNGGCAESMKHRPTGLRS